MKFPNPIYEHRIISGLTADQLAKLEALLKSDEVAFVSSTACRLMGPNAPVNKLCTPPPMLRSVPCLQVWCDKTDEPDGEALVEFAKSPKRDAETGLYTVDLRVVVAVAYAKDLEDYRDGWQSRREVGIYRTSRKVNEAIDAALGLYSDEPNGSFEKVRECPAFKDEDLPPPPPRASESASPPPPPRQSGRDEKPPLRVELQLGQTGQTVPRGPM